MKIAELEPDQLERLRRAWRITRREFGNLVLVVQGGHDFDDDPIFSLHPTPEKTEFEEWCAEHRMKLSIRRMLLGRSKAFGLTKRAFVIGGFQSDSERFHFITRWA